MKNRKIARTIDKNKFRLVSGIVISSKLDPVKLQQFQFNPNSHFSFADHTICNQMTKHCYDISYLPSSRTFVMTDNSFCQLVGSTDQFIDDVALALDINQNQAAFFSRSNYPCTTVRCSRSYL